MVCEMKCIIGGFLLAYLTVVVWKFLNLAFNKLGQNEAKE